MSAYLLCPAGGACLHREECDPAHQTATPDVPADGDRAHDALVEHLLVVHEVPRSEVGRLVSQARRLQQQLAEVEAGYAEAEAAIKRATGPDWQAGRHEARDPEAEIITPSLDEMLANPGATQTKYRVTYERVGRHGGRDGSKPPAPLTVWALDADGLAEHVHKDIQPYMLSRDFEVMVDLEKLRGSIFTGSYAGSFSVEVVQVAEGGERA